MEMAGAINLYSCRKCMKPTITLNINNGVTPFGIKCPKCGHTECYSSFYALKVKSQPFKLVVTHVYYRPSKEQFETLDLEYWSHVLNGGLMLCPIRNFTACLSGDAPDEQGPFIEWIKKSYSLTDEEFEKYKH